MLLLSLQLHEILEELQSDLHNDNLDDADIILIPEEDGDVTEEESGDETVADMNNLPPRILRSQVEIGTHSYTSVNDDSGESSIESVPSDVGGTTVERKPPKKKIKGARVQRNWTSVEKNFVPNGRGDSEQQVNEVHKFDMSPVQCFASILPFTVSSRVSCSPSSRSTPLTETVGTFVLVENSSSCQVGEAVHRNPSPDLSSDDVGAFERDALVAKERFTREPTAKKTSIPEYTGK
ncbi:uncharacterized protein LOC124155298 [Ischnura elegans]|uniref:uncharacterized protein LOC124155298 n=1 Tax=Ischnura elegans TaxID=197161 RepID=UPI001ED8A0E1|nr:uncharacterized protein LOC124155298 [Ischnura elegans]